jgi:Peroxiredoxin
MKIPNTTWKIRKDKDWFEESASDYFSAKRSLVVSLPGAFTPI